MAEYRIASKDDLEPALRIRLEMLRVVNELPSDYCFEKEFLDKSREYFANGSQTTVLAVDGEVIGCASMCYIEVMPTFSHPAGKRAHLMNVYTDSGYRRQGIAMHMIHMLVEEARKKGVTEISLDATEAGRPLYKKCGFVESAECMVLEVGKN